MVWRFVLLSFIISVTFSASNVALPYFMLYLVGKLPRIVAQTLPAGEVVTEIGALTAAFMATRVIISASSGFIAERIGRKRSILIGLLLYMLSGIGMILANSFPEVLAYRALQGVASALVWPVAESMIVDLAGGERTKYLMFYVMAMNLGFIFGPAIGGSILQIASSLPLDIAVRSTFFLLPIGALIGLLMVLKVKEIPHKATKLRELEAKVVGALYAFFVNGFINGFVAGMLMSVIIVYIMEKITSVPISLSSLIMASGLIGLILATPLTRKVEGLSVMQKFALLIGSALLNRITLAFLILCKTYVSMLLAMSILNFSSNIAMPLMRSLQSEIVPPGALPKVFGLQQASFNLGMIVGPLIGSLLYKYFEAVGLGGGWVFVISSLIGIAGTLVLLKVKEVLRSSGSK